MTEKNFTVRFNEDSKKVLKSMTRRELGLINNKLEQLEVDPYKHSKKLTGKDYWRIRAGDYRIIYTIDKGILLVLVIRIGLRKDIYKRL